jgi:hypothetical protein
MLVGGFNRWKIFVINDKKKVNHGPNPSPNPNSVNTRMRMETDLFDAKVIGVSCFIYTFVSHSSTFRLYSYTKGIGVPSICDS